MTELKTIVLEHLDKLDTETRQAYTALQNRMKVLEAQQAELEQNCLALSRLYNNLAPLIEGLNNIMQSK